MNFLQTSKDKDAVKQILPYILAVSIFMEMLDSTILNTALPQMAKDLGESALHMQMAIISYVLALALLIPISGYIADKFGTKKVFITALFTFSLGSLFCALSTDLTQLIISRVIQGFGGSIMNPVGRLVLIRAFPRAEFVKAMNYAVVPGLLGPIIGPLAGGYFVDYFSWHYIFLINIPIGIIAMLLTARYMPNFKDSNAKIDLRGFIIFGTASIIISIALELTGKTNGFYIVGILLLGILMLYFYYLHAKNYEKPLFSLKLFQVRTFRIGIVGNLACRLGIASVPLLVPIMIQIAYGASAIVSGWVVAPMAIMLLIGKYAVMEILDRFGYRKVLIFNTIIIGLLIISLGLPTETMSVYWFIPTMFLLGFFNSIQFTAMNSIAIAGLRPIQVSSGNSLVAVNQQLAISFGVALGFSILRFIDNSSWLTHNSEHLSFRYTFWIMGMLTILSSFVFTKLHPRDGDNLRSAIPIKSK